MCKPNKRMLRNYTAIGIVTGAIDFGLGEKINIGTRVFMTNGLQTKERPNHDLSAGPHGWSPFVDVLENSFEIVYIVLQ